jgi:UDP-glucose:(heptosyl)LPS alpha-1,3-glucosyltransferase
MKIAFLIWDYSPSRGGQERYLSRLVGALLTRGQEIHVFATRCEAGLSPRIRFHRVSISGWGASLKTLSFLRKARRMLARERFDIVSGMTRFYPLDAYRMGSGVHKVWMRRKADRAPARWISYARPFNWLALCLERAIFDPAHCRQIIANSQLCRRQLLSLYRYPAERVTVVYNGVDHDYFHPRLRDEHRVAVLNRLGLPLNKPVAIFVSNNLKRKGLDAVIRALALVSDAAPSLLVAGGGRAARYIALARRLGLAARIRFLGRVADVRPYYGASDFLVLPTRYDPFANVCLEAMACGLPVITSRDNGAAEIIDEGADGFILADPADAHTLAHRIAALSDEGIRAPLSAAARKKSLGFTVERNAEETVAVYRTIQEERHGHSL